MDRLNKLLLKLKLMLDVLVLDSFARKSTCKRDDLLEELEKMNDKNPDPDLLHVDARDFM